MYVFFLFRYLKVNNHASNPFYATLFSRPEYIFMQNDFQKEQYNFYVKGLQAEFCDKPWLENTTSTVFLKIRC